MHGWCSGKYTLCRHDYTNNTIVFDFPRFLGIKCMCKQWIPGSLFHSPLGMKLSEVAHSLNRNGQNKISYHTLAMPCHTQLTSTSVSSSGSPSRVPPSPSPPSPLPTREMVCGRSLHRSRKLDLCTQKPASYITGGCMFLWRHQNWEWYQLGFVWA